MSKKYWHQVVKIADEKPQYSVLKKIIVFPTIATCTKLLPPDLKEDMASDSSRIGPWRNRKPSKSTTSAKSKCSHSLKTSFSHPHNFTPSVSNIKLQNCLLFLVLFTFSFILQKADAKVLELSDRLVAVQKIRKYYAKLNW